MRKTSTMIILLILVMAVVSGCSKKSIVISPGPVMLEGLEEGTGEAKSWRLWVSGAEDGRANYGGSQKIGEYKPITQDEIAALLLETTPAEYVRGQLSRYLLYRGVEASSARTATTLAKVVVDKFEVNHSGNLLVNKITVEIAYRVFFTAKSGEEIGSTLVGGTAEKTSPSKTVTATSELIRKAMNISFESLEKSAIFKEALERN